MRRLLHPLLGGVTSIGLLGLAAPSAHAGSFGLREQSAIGQGQNFAGAAAGSAGIGSMNWNPATLSDTPGTQIQGNVAALFPYASITPLPGTSPMMLGAGTSATGDVLPDALLPSLYLSHQLNDRWWFGLSLDSPFGGLTHPPSNYAGQIFGRSTSLRTYEVTPNAAVRLTDWLSLGFGVHATMMKVDLDRAVSPAPNAPGATLDSESWGASFSAGATLTPRAGTEIGVAYRSSVYEALGGSITVQGMPPLAATSPIHLPDQVNVGVRQAISPDLTASMGYEWTRWSRLGTVTARSPLGSVPLLYGYRDGSAVNLGGEYRLTDRILLRSGVGYEWSPVMDRNRTVNVLDSDRVSVSGGVGYAVSQALSIDIAYSHYFLVGPHRVSSEPGDVAYAGVPLEAEFSGHADVATAGLTYRW